ncbi:MAG: hypothetical protein F4Y13_04715, partial [Acidimicrobiaceae bacterium]|nr:hypothetical protein [Acidimicrobiaceae bacterium]
MGTITAVAGSSGTGGDATGRLRALEFEGWAESRVAAVNVRVAVIGGGSWGTTVAHLCAHNTATVLYARDSAVAGGVNTTGENSRYLPGRRLHPDLRATSDIAEAAGGA